MNDKNQIKEYSFPDYDPDQQLVAVSKVVRQLVSCLDAEEKTFKNTDYAKINNEYAGDLYANDLCELGFLHVAVSHSAIAVFAPFLEGLFKHEIDTLQKNGRAGFLNHIRTGKPYFWKIQYYCNVRSEKKKGIAGGIFQILEALNLAAYFPVNTKEMLEIIFAYRNLTLHNGFEAKTEERNKFNNKIQANNWSNYFFWSTTDGKPYMISMKKEFITECFTFCRHIKEGFDKEKGVFEL
ncbi:MAG: hypothetical protein ABH844_01500 [Candidatus Omnitrophota bacterium]